MTTLQAGSRSRSVLAWMLACGSLAMVACEGRQPNPLTFGIGADEHAEYFPVDEGSRHALDRVATDGAISCDSCHAADRPFAEFSCVGCHEHEPGVTNAIHAGMESYRYESPRCLTCHPQGDSTVDGIDDAAHSERFFPIDDGSAHAPIRCSECHANPQDRSQVGCTSCHEHGATAMQVVHGSMDEYAWDSSSCLTCHARAQNPGLLSHPFFPVASNDKHAGVTCKECHASQQDRTSLACTSCHAHEQEEMAQEHQGVPDYLYDSGSCVLCHRSAQVPGVINHVFFPIDGQVTHALGTVVDNAGVTPNETISCASCHKNAESTAIVTCTSCHAHGEEILAPVHGSIPGYAWTDTACVFCHPNGEREGFVDHTKFPVAAGTVHAGIGCRDCHASTSNRSLLSCTSCHEHRVTEMEPVHRALPGYVYDPAACYACHESAQVPGDFDHEPLFPLNAPSVHTGLQCADCHDDRSDRESLACTSCHLGTHDEQPMNAVHTGIADFSWTPASCFGCHPNGTAAGAVFSHPDFPIARGTVHEGFGCNDCHTTPGNNTVVTCTACHLGTHDQQPMDDTHAGVPGFAWDTTQCLFCHPNGEATGNIDHARYFPIAAPAAHEGISCADCHTNPTNRRVVACAECHASDNPSTVAVHQGIPEFANDSPACLACHPNAEPTGTMNHLPFFPITSGTAHSFVSCTDCHESRTSRADNLCSQCHAGVSPTPSSSHGRVRGFRNDSTSCKRCHGDAQVDRLSSHPSVISPRHEDAGCIDCHRTVRADKPWAINFERADCVRCHSSSCTPSNQRACDD